MKELTMEDVQKIKNWLSKQETFGNYCILLPDTVEKPNDDEIRRYREIIARRITGGK